MMEVARTSETSVDSYFTRQNIQEDNSELHTRRRENLKSLVEVGRFNILEGCLHTHRCKNLISHMSVNSSILFKVQMRPFLKLHSHLFKDTVFSISYILKIFTYSYSHIIIAYNSSALFYEYCIYN
jgi:hypothetical protein